MRKTDAKKVNERTSKATAKSARKVAGAGREIVADALGTSVETVERIAQKHTERTGKLPEDLRRVVVQLLACCYGPTAVCRVMQEEFGVDELEDIYWTRKDKKNLLAAAGILEQESKEVGGMNVKTQPAAVSRTIQEQQQAISMMSQHLPRTCRRRRVRPAICGAPFHIFSNTINTTGAQQT